MDPLHAALLALGLVAATTVAGLVLRAASGRVRASDAALAADVLAAEAPGGRATLVQFSTPQCARCPGTARLLRDIAQHRTGVAHVEVDLAARPELADRFGVLQTPTVLLVDPRRRVRARIAGVPVRSDLERHLDSILERPA